VLIFLVGIIGEYVWRIYDSMYGIPKPIVSKVEEIEKQ